MPASIYVRVCVCMLRKRLIKRRRTRFSEKVQLFVTIHVRLLKRSITACVVSPDGMTFPLSHYFCLLQLPLFPSFPPAIKLDVLHAWFARCCLLHLIQSSPYACTLCPTDVKRLTKPSALALKHINLTDHDECDQTLH